jgi:hypothetical protein
LRDEEETGFRAGRVELLLGVEDPYHLFPARDPQLGSAPAEPGGSNRPSSSPSPRPGRQGRVRRHTSATSGTERARGLQLISSHGSIGHVLAFDLGLWSFFGADEGTRTPNHLFTRFRVDHPRSRSTRSPAAARFLRRRWP